MVPALPLLRSLGAVGDFASGEAEEEYEVVAARVDAFMGGENGGAG